jgi:hypothetical protein
VYPVLYDWGGVSGMLGQTMGHFNKTFIDNKNGRQFCYMVGGIVFIIWLFYYLSSTGSSR